MALRPTHGNVGRIGLDAGETMRCNKGLRTRKAKQFGLALVVWDRVGEVDRPSWWNG